MNKVGGKDALTSQSLLARSALALVAGALSLGLALTGALGSGFAHAQSTPSPQPTGPGIQLLNPTQGYDPVFSPAGESDTPKISDKFDGIDRAYHLVAAVTSPPPNPLVEAYLQYPDQNEITIGQLSPVPGSPGVYELYWDIPDSLADGAVTITVRLYEQSGAPVERANDSVAASMEQHDPDPPFDNQQADETIELTWPTQNGPLGFYKKGVWRTVIEGTTSSRADTPQGAGGSAAIGLAYSTTPLDKEPKFTSCASNVTGGGLAADGRRPFRIICALAGKDLPTQVTAIAAIAEEPDNPEHSGLQSMDSADVHVVAGYAQTPEQTTVNLIPVLGSGATSRARRIAGEGCLPYFVDVSDQLNRPVVGANVDLHLVGPNDGAQFGDDATPAADVSGTYQPPDKGGHAKELGSDCDSPGDDFGDQGDHNIPGGNDVKHRESIGGTGIGGGGGAGPGQWRFQVFSGTPGFSEITAWVDDEDLPKLDGTRPADNDTLDPGEPFATARAQWYAASPTLDFVPLGDSGGIGSCHQFLLRARAGTAAIPGINVDVHATGPNNDVDFCDPGGGSARRAPDKGDHDAEDTGEAAEKTGSPKPQHTEGETDDAGNFVVGITSAATGDTVLSAWIDGEKDFDNDVADSAEVKAGATMSWASTAGDAKVSFVNPSPYGGSEQVSNKADADSKYHIVARLDSAIPVQGVELQLGSGTGADFEKSKDLGQATQIAGTDTWELAWPVDVDDDTYTLRAHVVGTTAVADQEIIVNNEASMTDPTDAPDETVEITRPLDAAIVPFSRGSTPVEGVASAGADALQLYYTKAGANATPQEGDWIACGKVDLAGGAAKQPFKSSCKIEPQDQAFQITGIAALTFDCLDPVPGDDCDTEPDPVTGIPPGFNDSGDAHRVFGLEAAPLVALSPAENEATAGDCTRFSLAVTDQTGQALSGQNVDLHLTGPADAPSFCDPPGGNASPRRAPNEGGHSVVAGHDDEGAHASDGPDTQHTEGETGSQGVFVIGIKGNENGESVLEAWVDQNDNDVFDSGEGIDSSVMHWVSPSACTQLGTAGADVLTGTRGRDRICGRGGNDVIKGRGGNDILLGSGGDDVVKGGGGKDKVNGGVGNDRLFGNGGNDALKGNAGADRLNGGGGRDACRTGPGRDHVVKCEGGRSPSPRMARGGTA